ncbi:MAG: RNA polymerase sigma factor [Bacteroidales bacterium]|nr:RNA polymerase sigma factor [Bacteroidales bacterium]MDT8374102.1 RNA polymerase sigma factor [Bacteroidales bacterium]
MSDQELVKAVIRGDNSAMRDLISKYQELVLNTCYKVLQSREDAEDIAQEVFIETYRSAAGLRYEDDISFWLYRISLNKSINHLKRSQNILFRSLMQIETLFRHDNARNMSPEPHSDDHPGESLEAAEKDEIVKKAVATLPANQQKAFILFYYEELSYKEISSVLGLSVASVESLLFRARENLKKRCDPDHPKKKEFKTSNHDT